MQNRTALLTLAIAGLVAAGVASKAAPAFADDTEVKHEGKEKAESGSKKTESSNHKKHDKAAGKCNGPNGCDGAKSK